MKIEVGKRYRLKNDTEITFSEAGERYYPYLKMGSNGWLYRLDGTRYTVERNDSMDVVEEALPPNPNTLEVGKSYVLKSPAATLECVGRIEGQQNSMVCIVHIPGNAPYVAQYTVDGRISGGSTCTGDVAWPTPEPYTWEGWAVIAPEYSNPYLRNKPLKGANRCVRVRIRLFRWLVWGDAHCHEWEEINRVTIERRSDDSAVGLTIELKCKHCGVHRWQSWRL